MKVIAEHGIYTVEEVAKGEFSVKLLECTCEDQSMPYIIPCLTGQVTLHGCLHPTEGALTLKEIHLGLGKEFSFTSAFGHPPVQVLENCCRPNRIVEIIP